MNRRIQAWRLPPRGFLNHGSFGACPRVVLDAQRHLRDRIEEQPLAFFMRDLPGLQTRAREALAGLVGAESEGLVAMLNATEGVNTALAAVSLQPGDELVTTTHVYPACREALRWVAERAGAKVVEVELPLPLRTQDEVIEAVSSAFTPRTRALLLDHVTSPTGLVLPVAPLVRRCRDAGIASIIDGAHAPGMLDLRLDALGADFYTGNLHKWVYTPKGAAFLYVHPSWRARTYPLVISHGGRTPDAPGGSLHARFDWRGTSDPTAFLVLPEALAFGAKLHPGGWAQLQAYHRALALSWRRALQRAFSVEPIAPSSMVEALAAVRLPVAPWRPWWVDAPPYALHDVLRDRFDLEVHASPWSEEHWILRLSAQSYAAFDEVEDVIGALQVLAREAA